MKGPYRVAMPAGAKRLRFSFNGRPLQGVQGDTLASALLANGVRVVARSFKFHRPRGIYSAGVAEPSALLEVGSGARRTPSVRATLTPLHDGLESRTQLGWPSVDFDLWRVLDLISPVFSAGFYYKTFMAPSWHFYERLIRGLAGLGRAPDAADPDRYELQNAHTDVLVIGGGVAGLAAAQAAMQAGARVILVEQNVMLGGEAAWNGATLRDAGSEESASDWISATAATLGACADVRVLTSTTALGYYDSDVVTCVQTTLPDAIRPNLPRERYWIIRAAQVVIATGALEQPLVFCHNDRPGIMLAGAVREYLCRHGVAAGHRVALATNNDSVYPLAHELRAAGVTVVAVIDSRETVPGELAHALGAADIRLIAGALPIDSRGHGALDGVCIAPVDAPRGHRQWLACDALGISGGFSPTLHLHAQSGGKLRYSADVHALMPVAVRAGHHIAGAAAAEFDTEGARMQGVTAGTNAARNVPSALPTPAARPLGPRIASVGSTLRQWVDLAHDVTVADLEQALRENYTSIEHIKRYTTVGMSVDQGKTSHTLALQIIGALRDVAPGELGHTTLRPPYTPVTLGAIAGREVGYTFAPQRRTPLHEWHVAHGGLMEDYGEWSRAAAYVRDGEDREQAIERECELVRGGLGLFDASPLGKIEVRGPDALSFLDRFYINNLGTLKLGRARYGLMLRESGVIFDDGTVVMLAEDHYLLTTTSGNAGRVAAWLEEWHQTEWPHLRLTITAVTEQWAAVALTGQRARELLAALEPSVDVSGAALPHLGMCECTLLGVPARIYRVSFSGELTYEINVPSGSALGLWAAAMERGAALGVAPYGLESLLRLRLEKGFLHLGSDTNGTTVPDDVGFGDIARAKSADYIGRRSLSLPENVRTDRLQLVGLTAAEGQTLPIGGHITLPQSVQATDGWVTSATRLSGSRRWVALALVAGGRGRLGTEVTVHDYGRQISATISAPLFYDPSGARMKA